MKLIKQSAEAKKALRDFWETAVKELADDELCSEARKRGYEDFQEWQVSVEGYALHLFEASFYLYEKELGRPLYAMLNARQNQSAIMLDPVLAEAMSMLGTVPPDELREALIRRMKHSAIRIPPMTTPKKRGVRGVTDKVRERAEDALRIKTQCPELSQTALAGRMEVSKETIVNDWKAMGWKWDNGSRIR
jgi:hypothetical protein